jgi:hypothetical protein
MNERTRPAPERQVLGEFDGSRVRETGTALSGFLELPKVVGRVRGVRGATGRSEGLRQSMLFVQRSGARALTFASATF